MGKKIAEIYIVFFMSQFDITLCPNHMQHKKLKKPWPFQNSLGLLLMKLFFEKHKILHETSNRICENKENHKKDGIYSTRDSKHETVCREMMCCEKSHK